MMSPCFGSSYGKQYLLTGPGGGIGQLVYQEVIADQQRVFHRPRWYHEGLHQRCRAEQKEKDGYRPLCDSPARRLGFGCR